MRILFIHPLPFPSTRAYAVQLANMADRLQYMGHDVELWVPDYPGPFFAKRDEASLREYYGVTRLPKIQTITTSVKPKALGISLLDALYFKYITHAYTRSVLEKLVQEPLDAIILTREPDVAAVIGKYGHRVFWEIHTLGRETFTQRALANVDGVIPISRSLQQACLRFGYPAHASLVLPSGVDVASFKKGSEKAEARRAFGLTDELRIYGFAGRFHEAWKGRGALLEMARHLDADERLLLIGDFQNGVHYFQEAAAELGIALDRVIFTGHVAPQAVPQTLAAADVVLLPTSARQAIGSEHTSPLKLFEALALGRPLVASDVPSTREIVDDTCAWLVPPDDASAMLKACREAALANPEQKARVVEGQRRIEKYDWTERAQRLTLFLQERSQAKGGLVVPIFDGVIAKNIVDSGALQPFIAEGKRVLLWVYEGKADYYQRRHGPHGYAVAQYGEPRIPLWATVLQNIGIDSIPTCAIFLKHLRRMVAKKAYLYGIARLVIWGLGHVVLVRRVLQGLVCLWPVPLKVKALLRVERPSLIFCPTMVWLIEMQLVRAAKAQRISTVGMDKSWDNITTKLMLPVAPQHLLVPNQHCAEEAERFLRYPKSQMTPVGLPQFDRYHEAALRESRDVFCRRMNLRPEVPILLYCAAGLWMAKDEPEILLQLDRDIEKGVFGPLQVLVRLHPKYDCGADRLTGLKRIVLDRPGTYVTGELSQWEYEDQDLRHLLSSIREAAVTINTASTMSIEAAYFDRPVINIGFDPKPVPWALSVARYYEREHYKPILEAGGAKLALSYEQLVEYIALYLQRPEEDRTGRERVIAEQCMNREPIAARRVYEGLTKALTIYARAE